MKKSEITRKSLLHALGVVVYVACVALLMSNGERIFGDSKTIFIPIFMLLLFVVSAAVTGTLVLGKPVLLYLDGLKKEAWMLFLSTLAWLVACMLLVGGGMLLFR